jgi:hypothetical protein
MLETQFTHKIIGVKNLGHFFQLGMLQVPAMINKLNRVSKNRNSSSIKKP